MSDSGSKERSGFMNFVYNPATGTWFTRTPSSWLKIGLFYLVYYSGLAAFFAGMLSIFIFAFTDKTAPVLTGAYSVLPANPGMGFRPMPDIEKTLIKYNRQDDKEILPFRDNIKYFLTPNKTDGSQSDYNYLRGQDTKLFRDCTGDTVQSNAKSGDLPCRFKVDEMTDVQEHCIKKGDYGFHDGQPCVVIKMNKVFEFIPEIDPKKSNGTKYLQIVCRGEHPADVDNLGEVKYYPQDGFDLKYFPYLNQPHYLSPLVFAKFTNPTRGVLIQVVCHPVNAGNIEQEKQQRGDGRVHFELLIDDFPPEKKKN